MKKEKKKKNNSKANGKVAYRNMGVSGAPLGIGGWENSVDQNKCPDDLSPQSRALVVAGRHLVGPAAVPVEVGLLERFHQTDAADSAQALCYHVQHRPE